jgi:hypothetical protein
MENENLQKNIMDEIYKHLFGHYKEDFVEINTQNKEVEIDGNKHDLEKFLAENTNKGTKSFSVFSTKEFNKKSVEGLNASESMKKNVFGKLYVEMKKAEMPIVYNSNHIGLMEKTIVYNGFPKYIDSECLMKSPKDAHLKIMYEVGMDVLSKTPYKLFAKPKIEKIVKYKLSKDFVDKYKITKKPFYKILIEKLKGGQK